ncbi:hypothetical protein GLW36_12655 [Halorubrum terrestre]|uniref:Uncharacterized protein n=1 Tax=Halorubrum distributum TaxID=29283 RepID=A0A6B1IE38_9EURY|nr:hypothetical protein [Halorubrum terrestre]MYL17489.1 hypothetical protein [Halorubrum terrestre]
MSVGTLFSSGAFKTVEAERGLGVNALTDGEIADSDLCADLVVDVESYNTVAVTPEPKKKRRLDSRDVHDSN